MLLLNAVWRGLAATVCFVVFSVGGLVFSFVLFPLLHLLPGGRKASERRARSVIRVCFASLLGFLQAARILRLDVRNRPLLRDVRGALVLANHPSYLDVIVLLAHIRDAACVVKSKLWSNLFFGGVVRAAGYIRNDDPARLIDLCARRLASGVPVVIFPEGTRSMPGEPLHFLRGAAHIALSTGAPIVPVLMSYTSAVLPRGARWYQLPLSTFTVTVDVLPCTNAASLLEAQRHGPRRLTGVLERFFADRLDSHGRPAT